MPLQQSRAASLQRQSFPAARASPLPGDGDFAVDGVVAAVDYFFVAIVVLVVAARASPLPGGRDFVVVVVVIGGC